MRKFLILFSATVFAFLQCTIAAQNGGLLLLGTGPSGGGAAASPTNNPWFFSNLAVPNTGAVHFLAPFASSGNSTSTVQNGVVIIAAAGVVTDATFTTDVVPGGTATWTIDLRTGTTPGSMSTAAGGTCVITSAIKTCSITPNKAITAGDFVTIRTTPANTPAATRLSGQINFFPTAAYTTVLGSVGGTSLSTTVDDFLPLAGNIRGTVSTARETLIPTTGCITDFYTQLDTAPGATKSRTATLQVNRTDTAYANVYSDGTVTSGEVHLVLSPCLPVYPQDRVAVHWTFTGSIPTASTTSDGVAITMNTAGDFIIPSVTSASLSTAVANYVSVSGVGAAVAVANVSQVETPVLTGFTVTGLYARFAGVPGGLNKSYTAKLQVNGADASTPFTTVLAGNTLNWQASGTFTPSAADRLSTAFTPSATAPSAVLAMVSLVGHVSGGSGSANVLANDAEFLNTADNGTIGAVLDPTILAASTVAQGGVWTTTPTPLTAMTVNGADLGQLPKSINIRNSSYNGSGSAKSWIIDLSAAADQSINWTAYKSAPVVIQQGLISTTLAGDLSNTGIDFVVSTSSGGLTIDCVLQWVNKSGGSGTSGFGPRAHGSSAAPTSSTTGSVIDSLANTTYGYALIHDATNNLCSLKMYDIAGGVWTQRGSTSTAALDSVTPGDSTTFNWKGGTHGLSPAATVTFDQSIVIFGSTQVLP